MEILHLDFETRSVEEIGKQTGVGLHNYWINPSTEILMLAWCFGNANPSLWEPHVSEMPARLVQALNDPNQPLAAFNSGFERYGLNFKLGFDIPISRFQDPQASARYLSLPSKLENVGSILGLPREMEKDKRGDKLIDLFSHPHWTRKTKLKDKEMYFNDWNSHPIEWKQFGEYCMQDVVAEREIMRRLEMLEVFPLPERERKIWIFDQRVNDRGIALDKKFITNGFQLAQREKRELIEQNNLLTGLDNSNSTDQMLEWVQTQGYKTNSLRKEAVAAELNFNDQLTPLAKQALEIRKQASSTTYQKLSAMLRHVSPDNRLRNQFLYMGSSRCGRWSGNAVQLHNLARPTKTFEDQENVRMLKQMVYDMQYEHIKKVYGSVLLSVKSCIRTSFVADNNEEFHIADLNAIETRVAAWITGCNSLLKVFQDNKDPYLDFAVKMYGIPYEMLYADLHSTIAAVKAAAKEKRQNAKPAVLGCVYRLSGGGIGINPKTKDKTKTGLWKYCDDYGVKLECAECHKIVRIFRDSYTEIPDFWYAAERAVLEVMKGGSRTVRKLGPNGCIEISKLEILDRNPILRVKLPSGRYLHYVDAFIDNAKMPWQDGEGNDVYRESFFYSGIDQDTKQWRSINTHGGKLLENWTQAIARDVLAESLMKFEFKYDLPVVAHVHDEGITETPNDGFSSGSELMIRIMSEGIEWAPGLPLGADGFDAPYYHK
jgi:DNA polymerase bacteriophage-type